MADLHRVFSGIFIAIALAAFGGVRPAYAHIDLDSAGTHKGRFPDSGLKDAPCGNAGSTRGTNIYKYKPGATINISVAETIPHPGYFRIAFDSDGDDDFEIPSGTNGAMGSCSGDPACGPGKEDYCNNDTVLLDALDQHAAGLGKTYTWSVKLPDIECDNCTLQIIQMMNDFNFHFQPYPADDIYYQCIDIVLAKDAPDVPVTPMPTNGMNCKASANPGTAGAGGAAAGAGGGSAAAGASGGAATAGAGGASAAGAGGAAGAAPSGAAAGAGGSQAAAPGVAGTSGAAGRPSLPGGAAGSTAAGAPAPVSTAGMGTITNANTGAGSAAPTPPTAADSGGCSAIAGQPRSSGAGLTLLALALLALAAQRMRHRRLS